MSDPSRILAARLSGTALRLAESDAIAEAVAELRDLADHRADLLAEQAGLVLGYWSARPSHGETVVAAGLLVLAGADLDEIEHWLAVGQKRALAPRHGV